jgi:hypothetical protein
MHTAWNVDLQQQEDASNAPERGAAVFQQVTGEGDRCHDDVHIDGRRQSTHQAA